MQELLQVLYLRGPMFAHSGQGGRSGQISSNPRSSGGRSPKYSNSNFPDDFGGGGLFGSLSGNIMQLIDNSAQCSINDYFTKNQNNNANLES